MSTVRSAKFKPAAALLGAATIIALAGPPASAAPPYNVTVGTNTTGVHPFSAVTKAGLNFTWSGTGNPVPMSCAGSTFPSTPTTTVTAGPDADGLDFARFTNSTWTKPRVTVGGLQLNMTHFQPSEWRLDATGVATNALTDNVASYINSIDMRITSKPVGLCSLRATGRMNAVFKETPKAGTTVQQLSVNQALGAGGLTVSAVSGCLGLIANGNSASFTGDYNVSSPNGYINVKP